MSHDTEIVMSDLYPNSSKEIPMMKRTRETNENSEIIPRKVLTMFSQISNKTLSKLLKKYAFDLDFYGYSFDPKTFRTGCKFKDYNCC